MLWAGPANEVDEVCCSEGSAALQPTCIWVEKSIQCTCMPLVLLLHLKAEKKHPSSLACHWRWSSVLYNVTEHCQPFCQIAVFVLLGEHDRYSLLPSVLL